MEPVKIPSAVTKQMEKDEETVARLEKAVREGAYTSSTTALMDWAERAIVRKEPITFDILFAAGKTGYDRASAERSLHLVLYRWRAIAERPCLSMTGLRVYLFRRGEYGRKEQLVASFRMDLHQNFFGRETAEKIFEAMIDDSLTTTAPADPWRYFYLTCSAVDSRENFYSVDVASYTVLPWSNNGALDAQVVFDSLAERPRISAIRKIRKALIDMTDAVKHGDRVFLKISRRDERGKVALTQFQWAASDGELFGKLGLEIFTFLYESCLSYNDKFRVLHYFTIDAFAEASISSTSDLRISPGWDFCFHVRNASVKEEAPEEPAKEPSTALRGEDPPPKTQEEVLADIFASLKATVSEVVKSLKVKSLKEWEDKHFPEILPYGALRPNERQTLHDALHQPSLDVSPLRAIALIRARRTSPEAKALWKAFCEAAKAYLDHVTVVPYEMQMRPSEPSSDPSSLLNGFWPHSGDGEPK